MKFLVAAVLTALGVASAARAGPPYLTDDPAPTDTGHWEIYAFATGEGRQSTIDADGGFDLNYGAVKDVQLTATLPLSLAHEAAEGSRSGTGDAELAVKYRFIDEEKHGFSAAIFPRAILPTSSLDSHECVRILLPLWLQKDFTGGTSLFGGGGYEINPGPRNRSFWQAAVAVTRNVNDRLSVGAEITRQGPDAADGTPQTRAGVGSIVKLSDHFSLLMSGGPTWTDHRTGYRAYAALGLFF